MSSFRDATVNSHAQSCPHSWKITGSHPHTAHTLFLCSNIALYFPNHLPIQESVLLIRVRTTSLSFSLISISFWPWIFWLLRENLPRKMRLREANSECFFVSLTDLLTTIYPVNIIDHLVWKMIKKAQSCYTDDNLWNFKKKKKKKLFRIVMSRNYEFRKCSYFLCLTHLPE